tara:strand:+ start:1594 stop:2214 length:621 start_codon:yes stop_codon:yes gene_type:complete
MPTVAPTGFVGSKSPVIITYTNSAVSVFTSVNLKIYIWDGAFTSRPSSPTFTIARTSNFPSTDFYADISHFLNEYIAYSSANLDDKAVGDTASGMLKWCQVEYTMGYTHTDTTARTHTGFWDAFLFSGGYSNFEDGANYHYQYGITMVDAERYVHKDDVMVMGLWMNPLESFADTDWNLANDVWNQVSQNWDAVSIDGSYGNNPTP